ncbi:MAG: choline-sulfatase [bacterium]|nr:choline-sulfatase [bacterium]MDE0287923.1 choline-sulfatase [bacterium]MDE0439698.1 choline-sulfatase [bacterium]
MSGSTRKPNVLLVMADQLAPHFTGAYEHPLVRTPAMDSLVERGARFDSAYCPSPLCAPSRFAMMTGQPVSAIGAWDNAAELPASVPTLAHYLRRAGYRTTLSGKMHFVGPDQLHGFERRLTTDIYPADFAWTPQWQLSGDRIDKWYHGMDSLAEAGRASATYQIDYDEEVGFAAVRHLYDMARDRDDRPFFLVASFIHPHDPYVARPEWWDLYDHDHIDLPDVPPEDSLDPHTRRIRRGIQVESIGYDEPGCRNARHAYYANTSYFDSWLGALLRTLDETGQLDETVVIVTSDHGDMLGDRGTWFKMSFFERSARVPLIMAGPDIVQRTVPNACSLLDLLPTLLDAAAGGGVGPELAEPPAGRSLWESAAGGRDPVDETTCEYMAEMTTQPMFMIRRGRHKYIHCDTDPPLLYDLEADPLERVNLAGDPDHAGLSAAFAAEVGQRWDSGAIREQVLTSQRTRQLIHDAMETGERTSWDYAPVRDAANEFVRNHMDWDVVGPRYRLPASG